jgi:hypothetical protein
MVLRSKGVSHKKGEEALRRLGKVNKRKAERRLKKYSKTP